MTTPITAIWRRALPIVTPNSSDTAAFDNVVELLVRSGRPLTQAMLMMVPEAWERHASIPRQMRDFYRYHACLMEPWDGPALLVTTDGRRIAALLDRNGFRPFRYTRNLGWSPGTRLRDRGSGLDIANVRSRGRLAPGQILLIDPDGEGIVNDQAVKDELSGANPYGSWLEENLLDAESLPQLPSHTTAPETDLRRRQRAFGYTFEDLTAILQPMGLAGAEPIGSMGLDTPLASFPSGRSRCLTTSSNCSPRCPTRRSMPSAKNWSPRSTPCWERTAISWPTVPNSAACSIFLAGDDAAGLGKHLRKLIIHKNACPIRIAAPTAKRKSAVGPPQ